jgi:uncharacterized protein
MDTQGKFEDLKRILGEMESVLVAYSGGVDSTLLLKVAHDVLGDNAFGVIASSETYPSAEITEALDLAQSLGVRVINIHTNELNNPKFSCNATDRCYHCKMELFGELKAIAEREGAKWLVHGANVDDLGDYRPGAKAAMELGARAPLQEAGLTKAMIREISRDLGLPTWDKPSLACLASRFPYGTTITSSALTQIDKAEQFLKELGFRQVRVRHYGSTARIEVETSDLPRFLDPEIRGRIVERFKGIGYLYVTLDMEGYRTGSMNEGMGKSI